MDDLGKMGHRQTIYCLYRTLVMEDDAFETGYLVGEQYLKRTFREKHGEISEKERTLRTQKETLVGRVTEMCEKANLLIRQGEDPKAVRAMVEQFHEKQRRVKDMIQGVENKLNADKKLLEGREFSLDGLIKSQQDDMTSSASPRTRRGGSTAASTTSARPRPPAGSEPPTALRPARFAANVARLRP